jgi:hypothetical protein
MRIAAQPFGTTESRKPQTPPQRIAGISDLARIEAERRIVGRPKPPAGLLPASATETPARAA